MRLLSLLCLLLTASVASATHPVQVRAVVVQPQRVQLIQQYAAPVQALAVDDCGGYAQQFAVQQFYAAPLRVQAVQSYGYAQQVQQVQVQRVQAVQVQHVQQIQRVQVQRVVQPVQIQRSVTRTRTVIR